MGTGVEPTVTYPTTIDTYLTILEAANAASSTLNGALAADTNGNNGEDDKILVALSTLFPVNGGYVLIDNELIYYTGISGNNLITIKRGVNGTTIASHVDGSTVRLMVSEKYHNLLVDALIAIQTELGISPSGTSVTVAAAVSAIRARLDALEVTTHTQNTDTHLGVVDQNINMNNHKNTGLAIPNAAGDSIRATAKITEAALESTVDNDHTHSNKTELDKVTDGDHDVISSGNPHSVSKSDVGLGNVPNLNTTSAVANDHTHSNKTELDKVTDGDHDVRTDNPHTVTKTQVGLSNVPNLDTTEAVTKAHTQNTDTNTNSNSFKIGDGTTASNKEITAQNGDVNEPKIRYNETTNKWQYANDGVTFTDIGSGGGGSGDMTKAVYDTDDDGIVDKSETIDDGAGNSATAANVKDAVDKKHTQNTDTALGNMTANINMNNHKSTGLAVPNAAGDSIRATTKITETNLESAVDNTHVPMTVGGLPLTLSSQEVTFNYATEHFDLDGNNLKIKLDAIDSTLVDWGTGAGQINSDTVPDHNGHSVKDTFEHILNRGATSAITVTLTGGLGISWSAGELYDSTSNNFISTAAGSGNVTNTAVNYLKWVSGTSLTISTVMPSGSEILVAVFSVYDGNINGYRETSLMNETVASTRRALRECFPTRIISGMLVSEDTDATNPLDVKMSAGVFYKDGIERKTSAEIKSRTTAMVRHFHTAGVWDSDTNAQIETTNYDNGTQKTAIPANKYVKGLFIYMSGKIGFVYPVEYFNNYAQAEAAALPPVPTGLSSVPKLTAIVYQQGDTDFTNAGWLDMRVGLSGESCSPVTVHNNLAGLNDGDYQHMTATQETDFDDAATKKHTQNTDTHLGTVDQDIAMNTHKFTGLSVPDANGQSVRTTTKITEANLEDAIDKKHSASIIGTKEIDETDIANGKVLKYNSTSGKLEYETSSGGSSAWTDLSDTPSVLVARQMCVVNSGGTAFEFDSALGVELTSRTINFTTVDTATTAQAKIDAVGRYIPYGTTITFQFADGTCTLSAELHWNGFYGGGNLYIYGNTSETNATTLHTTQSVILDFDGQSCNGIVVAGCFVNVYIRNFKVMVNTSAWKVGIKVIRCPYAIVNYNYVTGTSTAAGEGINANSGTDLVCKSNYVSNTYMGLVSDQVSMLHSNNNDDTGTSPAYGLFANYTSIIGKEGTQPAGSVANESANTGSVIR